MLDYDDPRWDGLEGGLGIPYDPRPLLKRLERDDDRAPAWEELWENLHHEGGVGEASYASIPHIARIVRERGLTDWYAFALAGTIELENGAEGNPDVPEWLEDDYEQAWEQLFDLARGQLAEAPDTVTLKCLLGAIAIAKGDDRRGRMLLQFSNEELDAILDEHA